MAVSGDDRTIVSASADALILWDATTGREKHRFRGFKEPNAWMAAAGNTLVAANGTAELLVVDLTTGRHAIMKCENGGEYSEVAVSLDGEVTAAVVTRPATDADEEKPVSGCRVALWDVARHRKLRELELNEGLILKIALSPGGRRLALLRGDGRIHIWDVHSGREMLDFPTGFDALTDSDLLFSPTSHAVALNGPGGRIHIWHAETGAALCRIDHKAEGHFKMAFSPNGKLLAVSGSGGPRLLEIATGREVRQLDEPGNQTFTVAFSRDGKALVSGGVDGQVRIWDVASGRERLPADGHLWRVSLFAFSPDSQLLASADNNGAVHLWDVRKARKVRQFPLQKLWVHLAFAPDGGQLAISAGDTVTLWDLLTGQPVVSRVSERGVVNHVAFTREGHSLLCVENQDLVWRSPETLSVEKRLPERAKGSLHAVASPPDKPTLAAVEPGGGDVLIWDDAGRRITSVKNLSSDELSSFTLSPEGKYLAVCTTSECTLYGLSDGVASHRWRVQQLLVGDGGITFSADSRLLAVADEQLGFQVFELASGGEIARRNGGPSGARPFALAPDGRILVTAEPGGDILLWDLTGNATEPKHHAPDSAELGGLWEDLRGEDAHRAYLAVWRLAGSSAQSIQFLRERLRAVEPVPADHIRKLVMDLDSPRFRTREAAFIQLSRVVDAAETELRQACLAAQSAGVRDTLSRILKSLDAQRRRPTGDRLQMLRAVQSLEYMRVPESNKLLHYLASGAPSATLTREARAAINRLGK